MRVDDDVGLLGSNWLVILVSALIAWSVILVVAITFLRAIVGGHPSWWWAIGPLLLAGLLYAAFAAYRLVFAPRYDPALCERPDVREAEDERDA
jgi:hypothetical protein